MFYSVYLKCKIRFNFSGRIWGDALVLPGVLGFDVGEDEGALALEGPVLKDEEPLEAAVGERVVEDLVSLAVPADARLGHGPDLADDGCVFTWNVENCIWNLPSDIILLKSFDGTVRLYKYHDQLWNDGLRISLNKPIFDHDIGVLKRAYFKSDQKWTKNDHRTNFFINNNDIDNSINLDRLSMIYFFNRSH